MSFVPLVQGSGLLGWTLLTRSRDQQQAVLERTPLFARDAQAFRDRIEDVQTVDDLMDDPALLRVTLGAFGLDEDLANRAFIRRVLESDMADPRSFANRLNDRRYQSLARTFGFGGDAGPQLLTNGRTPLRLDSPEELLSNGTALRNALARFGLQRDEGNTYFLQQVLESDPDDPRSFVNRLGDARYVDFRRAFDFRGAEGPDTRATAFFQAMRDKADTLRSADDILRDPKLLKATADFFDLPSADPVRMRLALQSDTTNPDSFVNQLDDKRYLAMSEAFRFGWPDMDAIDDPEVLLANSVLRANALELFDLSDPGDAILRDALNSDLDDPASFVNQTANLYLRDFVDAFQNGWPEEETRVQRFVTEMEERFLTLDTAEDLVFSLDLYDATVDIFGLGDRRTNRILMQRVLEADPDAPGAVTSHYGDTRLTALSRAFGFGQQAETGRTYPPGFADAILDRYGDRQFETRVGEIDQDLRIALSFARELTDVVNAAGTNDGRWFTVMGTPPLRRMFETIFRLPTSFGTLDLDRQLEDFKARSRATFGTDDLQEILQPDTLEEARRRFLAVTQLSQPSFTYNPASAALQILSP